MIRRGGGNPVFEQSIRHLSDPDVDVNTPLPFEPGVVLDGAGQPIQQTYESKAEVIRPAASAPLKTEALPARNPVLNRGSLGTSVQRGRSNGSVESKPAVSKSSALSKTVLMVTEYVDVPIPVSDWSADDYVVCLFPESDAPRLKGGDNRQVTLRLPNDDEVIVEFPGFPMVFQESRRTMMIFFVSKNEESSPVLPVVNIEDSPMATPSKKKPSATKRVAKKKTASRKRAKPSTVSA